MHIEQAITLIDHPALSNASQMIWADLGCGSGLFTRALAHLLAPGSKIYAVDRDLSSFNGANRNGEIIIEQLAVDFISDSVNITKLDGILMANSLHFVSDKEAFIRKSKGLFRQQERFLLVEYDTDIPNAWVPYPISFRSMQQLFLGLGYRSVLKIHEVPSKFNQRNIYSAFATR